MEHNQPLEMLATQLAQEAAVNKVYGEPVITQGKTIIPVAKIVMGLGGGTGKKYRKDIAATEPKEQNSNAESGGGGSGGGAVATPMGVFEITEKNTRYIPANGAKFFILGVIAGAVIGSLLTGRKATYSNMKQQ